MVLVVGTLLATAFLQIVRLKLQGRRIRRCSSPLNLMFIPTTLELPVQDGRTDLLRARLDEPHCLFFGLPWVRARGQKSSFRVFRASLRNLGFWEVVEPTGWTVAASVGQALELIPSHWHLLTFECSSHARSQGSPSEARPRKSQVCGNWPWRPQQHSQTMRHHLGTCRRPAHALCSRPKACGWFRKP